MNVRLTLAVFSASIFLALASSAPAESFVISAEFFTVPEPIIQQTGFDWVFLPHEQPFDPKNPRRKPFDSMRPLQGVFTPDKIAVVRRTLSGEGIKSRELKSGLVEAATQIRIATDDGNQAGAIHVSASSLPDNKIKVKIAGSNPSVTQEASIASGDTMVLSFAGKEADSVEIYLIQIKNG